MRPKRVLSADDSRGCLVHKGGSLCFSGELKRIDGAGAVNETEIYYSSEAIVFSVASFDLAIDH